MGKTANILVCLGLLLCTASCEILSIKVAEFNQNTRFTDIEGRNLHRRLRQDGAGLSSALLGAARTGDAVAVQHLLDDGADPNYLSRDGKLTPLIVATTRDRVDVVRVLLNGGAIPGLRTKIGTSALEFAAVRNSLEVLKSLLTAGADPNEEDGQGVTPVHRAVIEGNVEMVQALVNAGGDVSRRTGGSTAGDTALHIAAGGGHLALVRLLLKLGAEVDTQNTKYKQTALHRAAAGNSEAVIGVLIKAGADVNHVDIDGDSPLFTAAYFGNQKAVQVLLENGGKRTTKNKKGYTSRDALCQCKFVANISSRCQVELCKKPKEMINLLNL